MPLVDEESLSGENFDLDYPASLSPADTDDISKVDVPTQTEYIKVQRKRRENISLAQQLVAKTVKQV